ncbi:hypothetical protein CC86DRAFT_22986 [Ophiobolus disseminans]|uniref:Uncharacterized protein n=1 Tax=Ophiobolus disseminans TaxID=1469910 RepID=A0A6A7A350_9PLEO|nr:hypothetical protein CC86DRAFT_22986 [Ophiobolus disseminans]
MLDIYNTPQYSDKIRCENEYWGMLHGVDATTSSPSAIVLGILIVLLAAVIEFIVNTSPASDEVQALPRDEEQGIPPDSTDDLGSNPNIHEQPQPQSTPLMQDVPTQEPTSAIVWCSASPSTFTRRYRLFLSAFLLYPTLALLYIRIDFALTAPSIDPVCAHFVHWPGPNWVAIALFNIIPALCAVCAFLRALTDCVLGCFGKGLSYTMRWRAVPWMPCMPVFLVGALVYGAFRGARWPAVWAARKMRTRRDAKMNDEERKGLVEGGEGEKYRDSSEGSMGYGSPKSSSDAGEKGDKIV